eukprot:1000252-Alexandrium_andersonii.AAC.2
MPTSPASGAATCCSSPSRDFVGIGQPHKHFVFRTLRVVILGFEPLFVRVSSASGDLASRVSSASPSRASWACRVAPAMRQSATSAWPLSPPALRVRACHPLCLPPEFRPLRGLRGAFRSHTRQHPSVGSEDQTALRDLSEG